MPELAVLLPVKDGALTIRRAVASTLLGMPRDAELVVIDDGSTDGTPDVLGALDDPRVRIIRHEAPRGVARSLNAALDATDSRFVARMDADDVTLPWRFLAQRRAIGGADHVFGSLLLIDGRGRLVGAADPRPVDPAQAPLHLLIENPFAHPTLLSRRTALEALGGYRVTAVEDYDLWLRAAGAGQRLRKISLPVLAYRRHAGQVTGSWQRDTDDPVLDGSYGALLPPELQQAAPALRRVAVSRDPRAARPEQLAALRRHVEQHAGALPTASRRRLLQRLQRLEPARPDGGPQVG